MEALLQEQSAAVEKAAAPAAEARQSQPQRAAAASAGNGGGGGLNHPAPPSMELLLDVEMPVSVSFGRTQLPLKEVIKLSTGSIIELNRTISEPVEVIVNNCVIARGEVVVIEGNYGVRIQQIVSRSERLKSVD
jgi:flagellar motor switch protein FliN/FliY